LRTKTSARRSACASQLKTTLSGLTGIERLRFRVSLAYTRDAYVPYTPLIRGPQAPGEPVLLFPTIARIQGFFGLQHDIGS
jgi:hypothetical protein